METRANYLLIGVFTIAGIVGAVGFLLWLAKVEVDRQYAYYEVHFDSVAGLGEAGDVRYNGLQVGQVVSLGLDPDDPGAVRVRIEVAAETPVRADTVARLESQGVTGLSYVSLSGGTLNAPPLRQGGRIPSEPSALQSVFEGAPMLVERAVTLLENVNGVFDETNLAAIDMLLGNLATSSGRIDEILASFGAMQADFGTTMTDVAALAQQLQSVGGTAETTLATATRALDTADTTLGTINEAVATDVTALLDDMRSTSQSATMAIAALQADVSALMGDAQEATRATTALVTTLTGDAAALVADARSVTAAARQTLDTTGVEIASLMAEVRATTETANGVVTQVGADVARVSESVDTTARTAARVVETLGTDVATLVGEARETTALLRDGVTGTLATADQTLQTVNDAAAAAQTTFVSADRTIASINAVIEEQLADVVAEVRSTVTGVAGAVDRAVADFGVLSTQGQAAMTAATETLTRANATLAATDEAMAAATQTLGTADTTFATANRILDEEAGAMIADLRAASTVLTEAMQTVSADITAITEDFRGTARSASSFMGTLDSIVVDNQRQVSDFLGLGLPEFVRFTEEARLLTVNMQRLVDRIERDPARFLFGTQASEFGR